MTDAEKNLIDVALRMTILSNGPEGYRETYEAVRDAAVEVQKERMPADSVTLLKEAHRKIGEAADNYEAAVKTVGVTRFYARKLIGLEG